jgi:hypothetical protein
MKGREIKKGIKTRREMTVERRVSKEKEMTKKQKNSRNIVKYDRKERTL